MNWSHGSYSDQMTMRSYCTDCSSRRSAVYSRASTRSYEASVLSVKIGINQ